MNFAARRSPTSLNDSNGWEKAEERGEREREVKVSLFEVILKNLQIKRRYRWILEAVIIQAFVICFSGIFNFI